MPCIRARLYRLRKNSCFVSGHGFTGYGKTHVLYQGTALQAAEKLMFCIRARLYRLRKNSCFVSGHDFTGCGKTHVLYQGTTLQAAEKLMFCIRARLYRLRKNSCFVSGHDFSRAVKSHSMRASAPEVLLSCRVQTFSAACEARTYPGGFFAQPVSAANPVRAFCATGRRDEIPVRLRSIGCRQAGFPVPRP
jgi:small basic protein